MALIDMVKDYQALLERKDNLAAQTKENNAAIEAAKVQIAQQMIDDDCPAIAVGGYNFSLQNKTEYTKKSGAELAENGIDFFDFLREQGLGDLIVETVNPRTLQSTIKGIVDETEDGELPEVWEPVINVYEHPDIARRKITKKGGAR